MRLPVLLAALPFCTLSAINALAQSSRAVDVSTQAGKEWELGGRDRDLAKRDGSIDDPAILSYVQALADMLSRTASVASLRVRLTRGAGQYASFSPRRVLYLSAGLFNEMEDEAELAGILAHNLAHLTLARQPPGLWDGACVLDPFHPAAWPADRREQEKQATAFAVSYLKAAGFDPTSQLSLLSKLAYGHPDWARTIRSQDLLDLRSVLENEVMPPPGYRLDSSDFVRIHATVRSMVEGAHKQPRRPTLQASR
jgi:predicted Zn-dependent protease